MTETLPECYPTRSTRHHSARAYRDLVDWLEDALLYALGFDIAGWPGHLRASEILERVGVDPVIRSARSA